MNTTNQVVQRWRIDGLVDELDYVRERVAVQQAPTRVDDRRERVRPAAAIARATPRSSAALANVGA